jgi:hypothetical protein
MEPAWFWMRWLALLLIVPALSGCLLPQEEGLALHDALLLPTPYATIRVEIDHQPGAKPDPVAIQAFLEELARVTAKRVEVPSYGSVPATGGEVTRAQLVRLHEQTANHHPGRDIVHGGRGIAYLHVLYLGGKLVQSGEPTGVGGTMAHENGLLVVFPDSFTGAVQLVNGERVDAQGALERAVLMHELGHALGLVNRGVPMQTPREDPHHPGHSVHKGSVMHHELTVGPTGLVQGPLATGLDKDDLLDLAVYRAYKP